MDLNEGKLILGWLRNKSFPLLRYYHHNGRRRVARKERGLGGTLRLRCPASRRSESRHTLPPFATPTRLRAPRYAELNHWQNKLSKRHVPSNPRWWKGQIRGEKIRMDRWMDSILWQNQIRHVEIFQWNCFNEECVEYGYTNCYTLEEIKIFTNFLKFVIYYIIYILLFIFVICIWREEDLSDSISYSFHILLWQISPSQYQ